MRNRALHALQQIKLDISAQTSIPQILYSQNQAGTALDSAMDMIADALSKTAIKPPPAVKAPGDSATVIHVDHTHAIQTVSPKPAKVIRAADLTSKFYLEAEAEVEEYLAKLMAELLAAIKAGQRTRIQPIPICCRRTFWYFNGLCRFCRCEFIRTNKRLCANEFAPTYPITAFLRKIGSMANRGNHYRIIHVQSIHYSFEY